MRLARKLTLRQLVVFVSTVHYRSHIRVAEALHLSPPAISMQLRQLEEIVNCPLFHRTGRSISLTDAGAALFQHAQRILCEIDEAEKEMRAISGRRPACINIGLASAAKYFMPKLLANFSTTSPGVDYQLISGNIDLLKAGVADGALSFAILGSAPQDIDVIAEPMAPLSYVIAAAANHPLRDRRRLSLNDLGEENFLLREEGSNTRRVTIEMLERHRLRPVRSQVMNSIETIKQSVMAGVGISLLPLHAIFLEQKTGSLSLLDTVVTPLHRDWYVVHSKRKQLCPAGSRLRTYLLNDAAAGLRSHFDDTEAAEPKPIIP